MLLWQGNSIYDTEADKRRLRNIRHDNKQDIDFLKKIIDVRKTTWYVFFEKKRLF